MSILIKKGRVIDPANNVDEVLDILIKDEKIIKVSKNISESSDKIINAENMWVVPGLIDLHVHLREPGYEYKETIETGSKSAVMGGVTTICAMPNTNPIIDDKTKAKFVLDQGVAANYANVLPIGSITVGQQGKQLSHFEEMKPYICGVSEDGGTVCDANLMKKALKICSKMDMPLFAHCEDLNLKNGGQIHLGQTSKALGLPGISNDTEDVIVARDIILARNFNAKLHICHISTSESLELVEFGKKYNENLTCEVAPHHFTLTDTDIVDKDTNFKMSPPLRGAKDKEAVLKALKNDLIDVIATDHAPHSQEEKLQEFSKAPNGIIGLETLIPLCITELVNKNIITPKQFVEKTSVNPAKIINLDKGNLGVGAIADITIIDVTTKYNIDLNIQHSKSKNSPFHGKEVVGKAEYTIVNGVIKKGE